MKTKEQKKKANSNLAEVLENLKGLSESEIEKLINELQHQLNGSPIPDGKYLSIEEVCAYLKVSRVTVWRYTKAGILKPKKIGYKILYARGDIDNLLNGMSHEEH